MSSLIDKYIELSELDRLIVEIGAQLERYPALLSRLNSEQKSYEEALAGAQERLERAAHDRRQAEKEIDALRVNVSKYLAQQNRVKTNKEYQAILHEIENAQNKIDEWETQGLEHLEAEDEAARIKREAEENLARLHGEGEVERQRIQTQIEEKQARLASINKKKAALLGPLDEEAREEYEILNKRYPGSAVAPMQDDHCGGCNWRLVLSTQQHVHQGEGLVRCDHCRRYLYVRGEDL